MPAWHAERMAGAMGAQHELTMTFKLRVDRGMAFYEEWARSSRQASRKGPPGSGGAGNAIFFAYQASRPIRGASMGGSFSRLLRTSS